MKMNRKTYGKFLLAMCGLGGFLYGIDIGLISAALPYLKATTSYTDGQLSSVVAAVMLGNIPGALLAAFFAEKLGRVWAIRLAAAVFTVAVPCICLSGGDFPLIFSGRILQGMGCGLVGIACPMYLAECLPASERGRGAGMFQLVLVIGLFGAALVGLGVTALFGDPLSELVTFAAKQTAWQVIFWISALPGLVLFLGTFLLCESPRWLSRRGRREAALASLRAGNEDAAAQAVMDEIVASEESERVEKERLAALAKGDTVFRRRYLVPFAIAFVVVVCVQASGVNSVLNYSVVIMQQAGLKGLAANWADTIIKAANFLMTVVACLLVDRKGRKFLLTVGSGGLVVGLTLVGSVFLAIEKFGWAPSPLTGVVTLAAFVLYISSFAVGPGVCVHLALSELMPTRIRATGMLICTMSTMGVSYAIAQTFLPWSAAFGHASVFFTLAAFMVVFFVTVTVFLPETKGKSLEEIERMFAK